MNPVAPVLILTILGLSSESSEVADHSEERSSSPMKSVKSWFFTLRHYTMRRRQWSWTMSPTLY